jgi:hypothetical protein
MQAELSRTKCYQRLQDNQPVFPYYIPFEHEQPCYGEHRSSTYEERAEWRFWSFQAWLISRPVSLAYVYQIVGSEVIFKAIP